MISVITPVFNGERFIEACIQVVAKQKCANVEHIIVDGASTDRTETIIKKYATKYPHVRWISEKDNGQSDALNKGIHMARGDILAVLNVDDYYEPGVLNRILQLFKNLPTPSLLVGNCYVWDNEGKLLYLNRPSKLKITDLLLDWSFCPHPVNPSAYFYHKSLHDIIGFYRTDMQTGQDLPFILSAVQAATVTYVDEFWGNWPRLEGSLTQLDVENGLGKQRKQSVMDGIYKELCPAMKAEVKLKRFYYTFRRKCRQNVKKIYYALLMNNPG